MNHNSLQTAQPVVPRRTILLIILALALITTSVPIVNWLRRAPGSVFTGYSYESIGDIFVYLNFIEQAKNGAMLFTDMFTPEPHDPVLFHVLYFVIGRFARWFSLSPLVAWHAARILLIAPLIILLERFLRCLPWDTVTRRVAFVSVLVTGALSITFSEASTFTSLLYSPTQIGTILCTLLFFHLFLRSVQGPVPWWQRTPLFFLPVLQAFLQPYALILWMTVPVAFVFIALLRRSMGLWRALKLVLYPVAGIGLAYSLLAFMVLSSPILSSWSLNAQGSWWTWTYTLLLAGGLAPLAIIGFFGARRRFSNTYGLVLALWFLLGVVLAVSPYPYGYRIFSTLHLPLAVLAAPGIVWLWRRPSGGHGFRAIAILFLTLSLADNSRHLAVNLSGRYYGSDRRYLATDIADAIRWVRQSTPSTSLFLASPFWDTLLAQQMYRRTYSTMGWQTTRHTERIPEAVSVYNGELDAGELSRWVRTNGISYIFVSSLERSHGVGRIRDAEERKIDVAVDFRFDAARYPFLREAFRNETVIIYSVEQQ